MTTAVPTAPVPVTHEPPPPPSHEQTVADLLDQSAREILPLRKTFVQRPRGSSVRASVLADMVNTRDERGLDAYLFLHALASQEPWNCDYPAATWVRAFNLDVCATPRSARAAVAKVFRRLEDRKLVTRARVGRQASVTLLREDGTGEPYEHPKDSGDTWLRLPYAYWRKGHYRKLSLPGKALLLVALSLPDDFHLPAERGPRWYGLSRDTVERGLRDLQQHGLLTYQVDWVREHKSPTGWREQRRYLLCGDFSTDAQNRAAKGHRRSRARRQASGHTVVRPRVRQWEEEVE